MLAALEREADTLATYQIDLLAELERQIRAVHHTMRHIEKLRRPTLRLGPELSNGQRTTTLTSLAEEMTALDAQIGTITRQHIEQGALLGTLVRRIRDLQASIQQQRAVLAQFTGAHVDLEDVSGAGLHLRLEIREMGLDHVARFERRRECPKAA
jgi:hypothetical protein